MVSMYTICRLDPDYRVEASQVRIGVLLNGTTAHAIPSSAPSKVQSFKWNDEVPEI